MEKYLVGREDVRDMKIDIFDLILDTESHHKHPIEKDDNGTLRWVENETVVELVDAVGLNEVIQGYWAKGWDKNSEQYRRLYRDIGYSLSGYWEIFYWDWNNADWEEYRKDVKDGES